MNSLALDLPVPINVIILDENSGGPSRPLNVGIESAKNEVLMILEQDDVMRPQRIASQLKAVLSNPECSLSTGGLVVKGNEDGDFSPLWPETQFSDLEECIGQDAEFSVVDSKRAFRALLNKNFGTNSSFGFTKSWFKKIGPFNENVRTCADLDFILRAVKVGPLVIVNSPIFEYRWRADSLHRQSADRSALEATMVRLRASDENPDWSGLVHPKLRYSAMALAAANMRAKNLTAFKDFAEVIVRYKGLDVIKQSLLNRTVGARS